MGLLPRALASLLNGTEPMGCGLKSPGFEFRVSGLLIGFIGF